MELGEGTESTPVVEDAQSHETRSGRKRKANSEQPRKTVRPGPKRSNLITEEKTWLEEYWKKNPVTAEVCAVSHSTPTTPPKPVVVFLPTL